MAKHIPAALKNAKKPEASIDLVLDSSLVDAYDAEQDRLTREASLSPDKTLLNELRAAIEKVTLTVTMRSVSRREFTELMTQCPPRDGNREDQRNGFNVDEMYPALVRASTVDPDMDDDGWALMEETLTQGEWLRLCVAAMTLNQHSGTVPFSRTD